MGKGPKFIPNRTEVLPDGTIRMHLTQNKCVIIDSKDYDKVKGKRWYTQKTLNTMYAYSDGRDKNGNGSMISMHRVLLGANSRELVDHIDGNGLNNVQKNIRQCSHFQNQCNRRKSKNCTSKHKGVRLCSGRVKAAIQYKRRNIHLGYFKNEQDAAMAYNVAAIKYFGEFACVNKIGENNEN